MRALLALAALTGAIALASCTDSGASERCQQACARDAECYEEDEQEETRAYKFDRDECEATCAALERDDQGRERVAAHAACLSKAKTCEQVLACQ